MRAYLFLFFAISLFTQCKSNQEQSNQEQSNQEELAETVNPTTNVRNDQKVPDVENIPLIEDQKDYDVTPIVEGLTNPWGMDWLPNGDLLYTEKEGKLYRFDGTTSQPIKGVPEVYVRGQGGLLDISVHPSYPEKPFIYLSYASSEGTGEGGNTAIARAQLKEDQLVDLEVLYNAVPNTKKGQHFGSRFAWDEEGFLYFTIGERGEREVNPQDLTRDGGKIYRIYDDGRIPESNPFTDVEGAKTAAYTYGNRNPQGMTRHPESGKIISHEHGPRGGDEINYIRAGANYGWPVISYGINYSGSKFTEITAKEGMEQPFYYWVPSIAPSGFAIIDNPDYGSWDGNFLVGSLKFQYLEMLYVDEKGVNKREKLVDGIGRLRNVKMGPDGHIYIGVEGKGIMKITRKS
ncbi:PQQ-dependent sugar dehydrogenase [Nonlabens xiamenensis]|uniref:PQQ-dependent sugar dehydrogenase n=1 Tax=Nonlabens xiamenensis TaxID=2341043 RepID=UPI000F60DAE0|nr:PQQ-dependent sugar dehydrogenase [Nonlabens xiamenensis]